MIDTDFLARRIDPSTSEIEIDGAALPIVPASELPLNRRYLLL